MHNLQRLLNQVKRFSVSSPWRIRLIVALLIVQAVLIAISARYPMAFDEDFHLGIIKIYAHHVNPFLSSQPAGADRYGAVARDPSYLYHYLMSFPYRLLAAITSNQAWQIIGLRLINIGLFAASLPLFRSLLRKTGASARLIDVCLVVFVLLPIVPLLAAQINYDNLLLLLTALDMLLAVRFLTELRDYTRPNAKILLQFLIIGLLACLVKYVYLVIFITLLVILAVRLIQTFGAGRRLRQSLGFSLTLIQRRVRASLLIVFLVSLVLMGQRYGVNLVRYHTPFPDCSQVLTKKACSAYGPWIRDYNFQIAKLRAPRSPITFSADWFYGMWLRTFFSLSGPASDYDTHGPLLLPSISAIGLAAGGLICVGLSARKLWRLYDHQVLLTLVSTGLLYIIVLWLDEYRSFLRTGQPVAINGRYLLPVLLPLGVYLAVGFNTVFAAKPRLKQIICVGALLCLLWGGGVLTFVLRSDDDWYWHVSGIKATSHAVKRVVGPLTPGNGNPAVFL